MIVVADATVVVAALVDNGPTGQWAEPHLMTEELAAPHLMPVEVANILRRSAMAGDISEYGNRFEISVLRSFGDSTIVREFDLTKKDIIHTEFFYVLPNDVIYAKPMRGKFFAMNQFPFALILSAITTYLLVVSYLETQLK